MNRPRRIAARPHRRALTLLEVVFAVAMLAMVTAALANVAANLARLRADDEERTGAYEIANRLILQYLDDPKGMPDPRLPIAYGRVREFRYRWAMETRPVELRYLRPVAGGGAATVGAGAADPTEARFIEISVRVFSTTDPEGRVQGDEIASITRVNDPIFAMMFRNPDVRDRAVTDPERIQTLIRSLTQRGGEAAPADAGSSGGRMGEGGRGRSGGGSAGGGGGGGGGR